MRGSLLSDVDIRIPKPFNWAYLPSTVIFRCHCGRLCAGPEGLVILIEDDRRFLIAFVGVFEFAELVGAQNVEEAFRIWLLKSDQQADVADRSAQSSTCWRQAARPQ